MIVAREGAPAPNFDLSSTEEAVLMLVDEVPRSALVLYFFAAADDRVRGDLQALSAAGAPLAEQRARVWAVSTTKLDELRRLQRELALTFPLLHDDRGFAKAYGLAAPPADAAAGATAQPVLALVSRATLLAPGTPEPARVLRLWQPAPAVASVMDEIQAKLRELPPVTASYPQTVVDRFVGWRVNR